jgi:hypothetical protein
MDIEKLWHSTSGSDEALNTLLDEGHFDQLQSKLPLHTLRKNLVVGLVWAVMITLLYIALLFVLPMWPAYVTLGILILFNITLMIDTIKLYRKIPATIIPSNSLKEELTSQYDSFQRWWYMQRKLGLFLYPFACAGGFMIGSVMGSGKPVEDFLFTPEMLAILGVTLLMLVPLCYLAARAMFNYAYGKHLKRLKATIDELS